MVGNEVPGLAMRGGRAAHVTALNAGNSGDFIESRYTAAGMVASVTDQNGTTHTYTYDDLGRMVRDGVTAVGTGIDDAVLAIATTLDDLGRVSGKTTYDAATGGNVVNDVKYWYDGWGNVTRIYQAHDGAVDDDGQGTDTPMVKFEYDDGAVGNVAKYVRLWRVTYPNGREVYYNYADAQSDPIGAALSRLDNVADSVSGTNAFVRY
ncbi:MAG: RHS repeat domain-containing protein, partial [Phycisphaerae bacterium]